MTPSPWLEQSSDVIVTELETETILLDPTNQEMYSLNRTGHLVWTALPGSIEEIEQRVAPSLDVDEVVASADIRRFVDDLLAAGLIRASPGTVS